MNERGFELGFVRNWILSASDLVRETKSKINSSVSFSNRRRKNRNRKFDLEVKIKNPNPNANAFSSINPWLIVSFREQMAEQGDKIIKRNKKKSYNKNKQKIQSFFSLLIESRFAATSTSFPTLLLTRNDNSSPF